MAQATFMMVAAAVLLGGAGVGVQPDGPQPQEGQQEGQQVGQQRGHAQAGGDAAAEDEEALPELTAPDTAVGRHLRWVMRVVNREVEPGDLSERFSERFLEIYKPGKIKKELTTIRRDAFKDKRVFITRMNAEDNSITATIVGEGTRRALSCLIVLDDTSGKIASLYFDRAEYGWGNDAPGANWDELEGNAGGMKGEASFGAYELIFVAPDPDQPARKDGLSGAAYRLFPLHEFGLDNRLAIAGLGSLFIMSPLVERIEDGTLTWDQKVSIDDGMCVLAGSVVDGVQAAPEGDAREIELERIVGALLDPGDAAAADHAIALVRREAIEKDVAGYVIDPVLLTPFLYRHEMLRVRSVIDPDNANGWEQLGGEYLRTDAAGRRAMLDGQVKMLTLSTQEGELLSKRQRSDADPLPGEHLCSWYATPRDLAHAAARVLVMAERERMKPLKEAIAARAEQTKAELAGTPMAADAKVWTWEARSVAQEPGVIAAGSMLKRRDGRTFILIAIQNHAERGITMDRMNDLLAKGRDIVGEYKFDAEKVEGAR